MRCCPVFCEPRRGHPKWVPWIPSPLEHLSRRSPPRTVELGSTRTHAIGWIPTPPVGLGDPILVISGQARIDPCVFF